MKKLQAVLDDNEATSIPELLQYYINLGHGPTQIANFIGVDRRTLRCWAKHFGVVLPKRCAKHAFPKQPLPRACLAKSVEVCSHYVEYNGQRLRVADEAKRLGITSQALRMRLRKASEEGSGRSGRPDRSSRPGWSVARALTEKRDPKRGGRQCES